MIRLLRTAVGTGFALSGAFVVGFGFYVLAGWPGVDVWIATLRHLEADAAAMGVRTRGR